MTNESPTLLNRLLQMSSRLDEQALEIGLLRNELDVQFKRIVELQAQLDVLPAVQRYRDARRAGPPPVRSNGSNR
jgi:hypothetical protein